MCSCRGDPAPGFEAGQRHDYRRRSRQDSRLRSGEVFPSRFDPGSGGATTTAGESSGGTTVGTAGYMSPEQALGKTARCAQRPFCAGSRAFRDGDRESAVRRAIHAACVFDQLLNRRPPSRSTLNPALPRSLDGHDRQGAREGSRSTLSIGGRFPRGSAGSTASSLLDGSPLGEVGRSDTRRRRLHVRGEAERSMSSSIAVLPFVDMSPGKGPGVLLSRDYGGDHQRLDATFPGCA